MSQASRLGVKLLVTGLIASATEWFLAEAVE
jgi:hypothetical protein